MSTVPTLRLAIALSCWTLAAPVLAAAPMTAAAEEASIAAVLDGFHAAAARADETAYFDLLAPHAVFLGTDATERWDREAFRAFAHPYFAKGQGWTFTARDRHVDLSQDGNLAWFDELLDSASYGECRGTGVLEKLDGRWKIRQYHLTIPMPNDLAKELVARIRAAKSAAPTAPTAPAEPSSPKPEASQEQPPSGLALLVEEDQADRRLQPLPADLDARDARRREAATALVRDGRLTSAKDWADAGLLFQHSHDPDDILVAHVLFTAAALEGHTKARFFFAASLDRYLTGLDRPQFFATQPEDDGQGDWRMPSAHPLLSPALRKLLEVPTEAELAKRVDLWRTLVGKPKGGS